MATITRTRVLFVAIALTVGFAIFPHGSGHAATGGTFNTFSSDPVFTSTSSGVTSSQAFPDGNTSAACFIPTTSHTGAATGGVGACSGITVTLTCASGEYDKTTNAPDKGAAYTLNGTLTWKGVYDTGTSCTTAPKVGGVAPTLTATVAGVSAGQSLVFYVTTDNGNGFNAPNGRNGCWQYQDVNASAEQCITVNYQNGPGGSFYEATAGGASGTLVQSQGAQLNNNGNMTLEGVFVEPVGQGPAPTNTPGGATNTPAPPTATPVPPTPTPTPVKLAPTIPARVTQFSADPTLSTTSTGVTSSVPFPDGSTTAACFVQVTSKSGAQGTTSGNCAGITVTVTCSSFQFNNSPTADTNGASLVVAGKRQQVGAYDTGLSCTGPNGPNSATLTATVSGAAAGTRVAFYWNNDASSNRDGCVGYAESTGAFANRACVANVLGSYNGTFYEVATQGGTGTAYETQGATVGGKPATGSSGNMTLGGVFIGLAGGGVALSAQYVHVSHAHGVTHLRWYSPVKVSGYNVFDGKQKINRRAVTSTSTWYTFNTRHVFHHLRIVRVQG